MQSLAWGNFLVNSMIIAPIVGFVVLGMCGLTLCKAGSFCHDSATNISTDIATAFRSCQKRERSTPTPPIPVDQIEKDLEGGIRGADNS